MRQARIRSWVASRSVKAQSTYSAKEQANEEYLARPEKQGLWSTCGGSDLDFFSNQITKYRGDFSKFSGFIQEEICAGA